MALNEPERRPFEEDSSLQRPPVRFHVPLTECSEFEKATGRAELTDHLTSML